MKLSIDVVRDFEDIAQRFGLWNTTASLFLLTIAAQWKEFNKTLSIILDFVRWRRKSLTEVAERKGKVKQAIDQRNLDKIIRLALGDYRKGPSPPSPDHDVETGSERPLKARKQSP